MHEDPTTLATLTEKVVLSPVHLFFSIDKAPGPNEGNGFIHESEKVSVS